METGISCATALAVSTEITVRERVLWSSVDAAGIMCYGAFPRLYEAAEEELFRSIGLSYGTLADDHGIWLVRRRVDCDFLQPVFVGDELEIGVQVREVGRSSLQLAFTASRLGAGAPVATSRYVLVAVDRHRLTARPLPLPVRAALAPQLTWPPA